MASSPVLLLMPRRKQLRERVAATAAAVHAHASRALRGRVARAERWVGRGAEPELLRLCLALAGGWEAEEEEGGGGAK